jgi:hypothetical protein
MVGKVKSIFHNCFSCLGGEFSFTAFGDMGYDNFGGGLGAEVGCYVGCEGCDGAVASG